MSCHIALDHFDEINIFGAGSYNCHTINHVYYKDRYGERDESCMDDWSDFHSQQCCEGVKCRASRFLSVSGVKNGYTINVFWYSWK